MALTNPRARGALRRAGSACAKRSDERSGAVRRFVRRARTHPLESALAIAGPYCPFAIPPLWTGSKQYRFLLHSSEYLQLIAFLYSTGIDDPPHTYRHSSPGGPRFGIAMRTGGEN